MFGESVYFILLDGNTKYFIHKILHAKRMTFLFFHCAEIPESPINSISIFRWWDLSTSSTVWSDADEF